MPAFDQAAVLELNDTMVKEICSGVDRTLSSVFGVRPLAGKHYVANDHTAIGDVSGVVSLTQSRLEGALMVSFPSKTIFGILEKVYKREFTEIDTSTRQGVGEITNMIFGVFKTNLVNYNYVFKMVIPSVLTGDQSEANAPDGAPKPVSIFLPGQSLVIPFETDVGPFSVSLLLYPEEYVRFKVA